MTSLNIETSAQKIRVKSFKIKIAVSKSADDERKNKQPDVNETVT